MTFGLGNRLGLTGIQRIVDGDTLAIGATQVRLEGIYAHYRT